ncbi:MAG: winged helix-turn-helix domain-containing protein [Acidobacteriia bacterium]|nr:winged helix-turn-helix domain-containing protein [Terriglobia bacterium]
MRELASLANHIRFGVFEVDLRTGELRKQGLKLKLQIQPFRILAMLLERPGELITREEIREKLWPADTFIDFEHSVNSSIKKLREVLCDDAEKPRYIETLPRRGYRFIAPVETARRAVSDTETVGPGVADTEAPQPRAVADTEPVETARRAVSTSVPPFSTGGFARRAITAVIQGALDAHRAQMRWRRLAVFGVGLAALALGLALLFIFNLAGLRDRLLTLVGARHGVPVPKIESIAVLPLENVSRDPEQEYFADGMTDELITNLGKIGALRVISRTTAMHYKGTKKTLPEIARELDVDAVVEGSVLRSGSRVRITANLLHAPTDRHLWAESYESDLSDVLVLQGEVARAIAGEIQGKLTPQQQVRLATTRAVNPEAHDAYLKGRYLLTRLVVSHGGTRTQEGIDTALEYFQLALKKDPNYAPGYVGIGFAWGMRAERGFLPAREAFPKAKAAALKALELDNTLADAHGLLARIQFCYEWDWAAAERGYKRAIELNPNSGELRTGYMDLLHVMQRPQEAKAQIERALELDPLNPRIQYWFGLHLMFSRQYDAAIAQAYNILKMEPDASLPHVVLQSVFQAKGMFDEQLAEGKKADAGDRELVEAMDRGYARGGYREAMRLSAETLVRRSKRTYVSATGIAVHYADAGEKDRAMEWLEKAYAERKPDMVHLGVAPDWDPVRSDPRFQALLRRMNFPP